MKESMGAKLQCLGINPDTFYNVPLGSGPVIGNLPKATVVLEDCDWSTGRFYQSIGRLKRKPLPPPKIVRIGRYYTLAKIAGKVIPRSLKLQTRRKAKKFFKAPFIMNYSHRNLFDEGS